MSTLFEVKAYLSERGRAPLTDIAVRFDTSLDAARAMVDVWIAKNRARRVDMSGEHADCGSKKCAKSSCCAGKPQNLEVYEWIDLTSMV